jgi:hypothetical protein
MRGLRVLVVLAAFVATIALPATANAATTYTISGTEINPSPATFVGSLTNQVGYWKGVVYHEPLNYSGTTTITGGYFTVTAYTPSYRHVTGTIDPGGTIVAGPVSSPDGFTCTQTFTVSGTLNGGTGSFAGTLTHYGILYNGRCNAFAASFTGSVTL